MFAANLTFLLAAKAYVMPDKFNCSFSKMDENNSHVKKMGLRKSDTCVHTYINSKRIDLESPCWSGFEAFQIFFKTCVTGAF